MQLINRRGLSPPKKPHFELRTCFVSKACLAGGVERVLGLRSVGGGWLRVLAILKSSYARKTS